MPAEWAPHRRCWMSWPCRESFWGDKLSAAREAHARIAAAIAEFEPVRIVARPRDAEAARGMLAQAGTECEVWEFPLDDSWIRDNGPTFVRCSDESSGETDSDIALVDWRFNAWGGKHRGWREDDRLPGRMARRLGMRCFRAPLVMEGGSFDADGEGTLLTTEQCLLNPNRNPGWTRGEIESELRRFTGAEKIVWLAGDPRDAETDGHVDEVARFISPGRVVAMAGEKSSPSHAALAENIARLKSARDARGRRLEVLLVPQPFGSGGEGGVGGVGGVGGSDGTDGSDGSGGEGGSDGAGGKDGENGEGSDLLGSYVNFYIANGGVVMPKYGLPEDARAREAIARAFPARRVVQAEAKILAYGGGGIHCITQQQPL